MKILDRMDEIAEVEDLAAAFVGLISIFIAIQTDALFFKIALGVIGAALIVIALDGFFGKGEKR